MKCANCAQDRADVVHRIRLLGKGASVCLDCATNFRRNGFGMCVGCGIIDNDSWVVCEANGEKERRTICTDCYDRLGYVACHCGIRVLPNQTILGACPRCVAALNREGGKFFYSDYRTLGSTSSSTKEIYFPRPFGVELEAATDHVRKGSTNFNAVRDGSIGGQEFVSPILYGDDGAKAIRDLCNIKGIAADVKCGLHVHLNAKDLNWWQVLQIARGYTLVQSILFDMMPPSRRNNRHCRMITTPYFLLNTKEQILGSLYAAEGGAREGMKKKRIDKRYEFLNTHAFFYLGTVEIRLHEGTFEANSIINWVNLNQALFHYFLQTPVRERDNPFEHFRKAINNFPDLLGYVQKRLEEFGRKASVGFLLNPTKHKVHLLKDDYHGDADNATLQKTIETWMQVIDMALGKPTLGVKKVVTDLNAFTKLDIPLPKKTGGEATPPKKEVPLEDQSNYVYRTDAGNPVFWGERTTEFGPPEPPTGVEPHAAEREAARVRRRAMLDELFGITTRVAVPQPVRTAPTLEVWDDPVHNDVMPEELEDLREQGFRLHRARQGD